MVVLLRPPNRLPAVVELRLSHVDKVFAGKVRAVRDFSLEIPGGQLVVLVGPSGCGKTTTLRLIAGLEKPSSGSIWMDGRPVHELPPKARNVAMVFQSYALYPHMTVRDNMAFALKLRGVARRHIRTLVDEAAEILALEPLLHRYPAQLSGGQRQRVALGRAMVRQPDVFLFDEPLSNLDPMLRVSTRREMKKLNRRLGRTMIHVTHDQTEAMTMGDRVVVMNQGVIQQVADPDTLYHRPANLFVAGFIGAPPMNLLHGQIQFHGGLVLFDGGAVQLPLPNRWHEPLANRVGRRVVLGIRPEHIVPGSEQAGTPRIAGEIEMMESLGAESHIHLACGQHRLICRVPPAVGGQIGQRVDLIVDMERMHLFDADSQLAIVPRP